MLLTPSLAHRRCARTRWSSPWPAGTPARPSGRRVWSTTPSSGSLRSPSQSPKPFCAAKVPASATGKFHGETQTAGAGKGLGMALSLPFMSALSESKGMITDTSPGETPASPASPAVLLHPLTRGSRAGAAGAAHISPSMLQWQDSEAAAGARQEG